MSTCSSLFCFSSHPWSHPPIHAQQIMRPPRKPSRQRLCGSFKPHPPKVSCSLHEVNFYNISRNPAADPQCNLWPRSVANSRNHSSLLSPFTAGSKLALCPDRRRIEKSSASSMNGQPHAYISELLICDTESPLKGYRSLMLKTCLSLVENTKHRKKVFQDLPRKNQRKVGITFLLKPKLWFNPFRGDVFDL